MTALILNYAAGRTGFKPLLDKRSIKSNDKYEFTHHIKHAGSMIFLFLHHLNVFFSILKQFWAVLGPKIRAF